MDDILYFDMISVPKYSKHGYILRVDLMYPIATHDYHNDLHFCVEVQCSPKLKFPKLIHNLYKKSKYVIHIKNLDHGLVIVKMHITLK